MRIEANHVEAYNLLHEGAIVLADCTASGIRIDLTYCRNARKGHRKKIRDLQGEFLQTEVGKTWQKTYGAKLNLNSDPQLARILFKELRLKSQVQTTKGGQSVNKESLRKLKRPDTNLLIEFRALKKGLQYLEAIERESIDGILHNQFHLNGIPTYRSSSSNINFQNIPSRSPEMKKLIRKAFIPREGRQIGEADFSGIEVAIAACYHRDPNMITYLDDPSLDMHRDVAIECFLLDGPEMVTKAVRHTGKNKFVFPQFYGDYYKDCAESMWSEMELSNLMTAGENPIPIREWLRGKGIKSYSAFEKHIQEVENRFWNERFKGYSKWKKKWLADYIKRGFFDTLTGFRCSGFMKKNEAINYPVQGSAFHILLWSMIQLRKYMKEKKMGSQFVGQIHDSQVLDMYPKEREEIFEAMEEIATRRVRKHWSWINVPLKIDKEIAPVDRAWYFKKAI